MENSKNGWIQIAIPITFIISTIYFTGIFVQRLKACEEINKVLFTHTEKNRAELIDIRLDIAKRLSAIDARLNFQQDILIEIKQEIKKK